MRKKIVFLTGAGMSVESGFKTFRGKYGLWADFPAEEVATKEAVEKQPDVVCQFFNQMRAMSWDAEPNEGHRLIAELEKDYDVTVITQNVDPLHEKAGSSHVIYLHGEVQKVTSSEDPNNPLYIQRLTRETSDTPPGARAADGSPLRPYLVFYGEPVPHYQEAVEAMKAADMLVIIGTSLIVTPARGLTRRVRKGTPIYIIDPSEVNTKRLGPHTQIYKGASEGMRELVERLKMLKTFTNE